MKKFLLLSILFSLSILIPNSCLEKPESLEKNIKTKLIRRSDCKQNFEKLEITDSMSCIKFNFNDNLLTLHHINAGFNCCPKNISCNNTIQNNTIIIIEKEESALCDCNCLFDLEIQVSGLENKKYFIKIKEPYVGTQEKLFFEIDLSKYNNGVHCVERLKYPWGL